MSLQKQDVIVTTLQQLLRPPLHLPEHLVHKNQVLIYLLDLFIALLYDRIIDVLAMKLQHLLRLSLTMRAARAVVVGVRERAISIAPPRAPRIAIHSYCGIVAQDCLILDFYSLIVFL